MTDGWLVHDAPHVLRVVQNAQINDCEIISKRLASIDVVEKLDKIRIHLVG